MKKTVEIIEPDMIIKPGCLKHQYLSGSERVGLSLPYLISFESSGDYMIHIGDNNVVVTKRPEREVTAPNE